MAIEDLFPGNENDLEITLTDPRVSPPTAVTDAAPVVTLVDMDDVNVSGQTWPLAMAHIGSGLYRGTLSKDLVITVDGVYIAHVVDAAKGFYLEQIYVATTRTGCGSDYERKKELVEAAGLTC